MKTKIYTLLHPITKEIRYVGKTIQSLDTRLAGHIRDSFRHRTHNGNWIRGLLSRGLYPEIMIQDENSQKREWVMCHLKRHEISYEIIT